MKKLTIFVICCLLASCTSTKQEVSPMVQKKYYKIIVSGMDSTDVKSTEIVSL